MFGASTVGILAAVVLSSVLFGLAHTEQGTIGVILTFLDALFFSFLRWRFKNLRAAVLGHGLNNTTGLVSVYLVGSMMDCGSQERKVIDETRAHCSAAAERAITVAGLLMATTVALITGLCWLSWLRAGIIRTIGGVA
jgi:Type II CAAX prenyl endopeptidase Rce1-like